MLIGSLSYFSFTFGAKVIGCYQFHGESGMQNSALPQCCLLHRKIFAVDICKRKSIEIFCQFLVQNDADKAVLTCVDARELEVKAVHLSVCWLAVWLVGDAFER